MTPSSWGVLPAQIFSDFSDFFLIPNCKKCENEWLSCQQHYTRPIKLRLAFHMPHSPKQTILCLAFQVFPSRKQSFLSLICSIVGSLVGKPCGAVNPLTDFLHHRAMVDEHHHRSPEQYARLTERMWVCCRIQVNTTGPVTLSAQHYVRGGWILTVFLRCTDRFVLIIREVPEQT